MNVLRIVPDHGQLLLPFVIPVGAKPTPVRAVEFKNTFIGLVEIDNGEHAVGAGACDKGMTIDGYLFNIIFASEPVMLVRGWVDADHGQWDQDRRKPGAILKRS